MSLKEFRFEYEEYENSDALNQDDAALLTTAREATKEAYAPYSRFSVGAAARLVNKQIIKGTNQENASYPVTICAERVLLANAVMQFPEIGIETLAISYQSSSDKSDTPISPCGMCRQSLQEFESRTNQAIRIILSGQQGKVIVLKNVNSLLPFAFSAKDLE